MWTVSSQLMYLSKVLILCLLNLPRNFVTLVYLPNSSLLVLYKNGCLGLGLWEASHCKIMNDNLATDALFSTKSSGNVNVNNKANMVNNSWNCHSCEIEVDEFTRISIHTAICWFWLKWLMFSISSQEKNRKILIINEDYWQTSTRMAIRGF